MIELWLFTLFPSASGPLTLEEYPRLRDNGCGSAELIHEWKSNLMPRIGEMIIMNHKRCFIVVDVVYIVINDDVHAEIIIIPDEG